MNRNTVDLIYLLSGTKFFCEWLLITNPTSKNPLIKLFFGWAKKSYTAFDPEARLQEAWKLGFFHLWFSIICIITYGGLDKCNIFVNIYPIFTQIYIGYRCNCILKKRKRIVV